MTVTFDGGNADKPPVNPAAVELAKNVVALHRGRPCQCDQMRHAQQILAAQAVMAAVKELL